MFKTNRKTLIGSVVSDSCPTTRVVLIERSFKHPLYKKVILKKKKIMIHDSNNASKNGDKVRIVECKPVSKRKRWSLMEVLNK